MRGLQRRDFLRSTAAMATASHAATSDTTATTITEAPRKTPVIREVDVLVAGGGPAGIGAALAAAAEGARVLVVERHGMLGSVWTAGLMNPFFDPEKGWTVRKLIDRMKAAGAWNAGEKREGGRPSPVFDVELMKYVLESMLTESNVEFWYHALITQAIVEGDRVRGAIVESKSGREAVLAKVSIDCTGDGDLAARAGVPFVLGREKDGLAQPLTLMFEIDNIERLGDRKAADLKIHGIYRELSRAIEKHQLPIRLPYGPQRSGTPYLIRVPRPGAAAIQATHMYKVDCTDTRALTKAIVEGRRQVHEVFMRALKCIPGMENIRLTVTAPTVGVRECRHLEGRYRLDIQDLQFARSFDDAVTSTNFHIDLHELDPNSNAPKLELPPGVDRMTIPMCDIPYRSLLPKHLTGLLFAGRCISGSHLAHASYRVTGTCMATGQGAGLAAALSARRGVTPDKIDGRELHAELVKRGAIFRKAV